MKDKDYIKLKKLVMDVSEYSERELDRLNDIIDDIIRYKSKNEEILSEVFDNMLSLVFVDMDKLKQIYYKFSKYVSTFNKELALDYEKIFEEDFMNEDDFDD